MKKFVALLLVCVLVLALSCAAFAASDVQSPEGNKDVPVDSDKTPSPQTGEPFSVVWVMLGSVLLLGAVLYCGKKLLAAK